MSNEAAALIVTRRSHRRSATDGIGLPPLGSLTGRPGTDETKRSFGICSAALGAPLT